MDPRQIAGRKRGEGSRPALPGDRASPAVPFQPPAGFVADAVKRYAISEQLPPGRRDAGHGGESWSLPARGNWRAPAGAPRPVLPVVPARLVLGLEAEPRLVDQLRRPQGVVRSLPRQPSRGDPAQLVIDERQDLAESLPVASIEPAQQPRHISNRLGHLLLESIALAKALQGIGRARPGHPTDETQRCSFLSGAGEGGGKYPGRQGGVRGLPGSHTAPITPARSSPAPLDALQRA